MAYLWQAVCVEAKRAIASVYVRSRSEVVFANCYDAKEMGVM